MEMEKTDLRKRKGVFIMPMTAEEERLNRKMRWHVYCKNCGFTGLADAFTFVGPQDAVGARIICPQVLCLSGNLTNAAHVELCENCKKAPAEDGRKICLGCFDLHTKFVAEEKLRSS